MTHSKLANHREVTRSCSLLEFNARRKYLLSPTHRIENISLLKTISMLKIHPLWLVEQNILLKLTSSLSPDDLRLTSLDQLIITISHAEHSSSYWSHSVGL
nr:hypothetical transcript [Hymenolepis microstoma]